MPLVLYYRDHLISSAQYYKPWCTLSPAQAVPEVEKPALWLDDTGRHQGLGLLMPGFKGSFFISDEAVAERQKGLGLLVKACGLKGAGQSLVDPFAGYGLDAICLAQAGFSVTAVEREQVVWLLLQDVVARQGLALETVHGDGIQLLQTSEQRWDVVYLDPMFPRRNKRALPNRGLQHLQVLTREHDAEVDLETVLRIAQRAAKGRVVLKRRARDPVIGSPAFQVKGQAVRFDVYV
ncbi:MAG: class I SAM-dependent methyltransferase [Pseudomonadaceae bacterium]|nr:class I SAM-dependent methyltransferase [Pseudomonadaceae bacterium]